MDASDVEQADYSFKVFVVVEMDGHRAFATAGTLYLDIGVQLFPHLGKGGTMSGRQFFFGGNARTGRCFGGLDQLFGLMDREVSVDNLMQDGEVPFRVFDIN